MKAVETIVSYGDMTLTVLVETKADDATKAYVSYFINGKEVVTWQTLHNRLKTLLTTLADNVCEDYKLQKWSY